MKPTIMLMALLLLSACSLGGGDGGPTIKDVDFHKGTEGITLEFVEQMPPEEIYESELFTVGLEIRNRGAWHAKDAKILLGGFDPQFITIEDDLLLRRDDMFGKNFTTPEGYYEFVTFDGKNEKIPFGDEYEVEFLAKVCYGYKTEAASSICVDPQRPTARDAKPRVCEVEGISFSGGQGAPVEVSKIEPDMVYFEDHTQAKVVVHFTNRGKGQIYSHLAYYKPCAVTQDSYKIEEGDIDVVVASATLSGQVMDCDPNVEGDEATVKVNSGGSAVTCVIDIDSKDEYFAPVIVTLKYGYVSQESTTMVVKR